jgi:hypothetical protein
MTRKKSINESLTPHTHVARKLGISDGTARSIERKALGKFKRELELRGIKVQDLLQG